MEFALSAARWVVGKALAPVTEGLLEAWAASENLGAEVDALTTELHYAQAMLNNTCGREIDNPALGELLLKLRLSAYDAEDVLDKLDYFRIEDELHGTSRAADEHPGGVGRGGAARERINWPTTPLASRGAPLAGGGRGGEEAAALPNAGGRRQRSAEPSRRGSTGWTAPRPSSAAARPRPVPSRPASDRVRLACVEHGRPRPTGWFWFPRRLLLLVREAYAGAGAGGALGVEPRVVRRPPRRHQTFLVVLLLRVPVPLHRCLVHLPLHHLLRLQEAPEQAGRAAGERRDQQAAALAGAHREAVRPRALQPVRRRRRRQRAAAAGVGVVPELRLLDGGDPEGHQQLLAGAQDRAGRLRRRVQGRPPRRHRRRRQARQAPHAEPPRGRRVPQRGQDHGAHRAPEPRPLLRLHGVRRGAHRRRRVRPQRHPPRAPRQIGRAVPRFRYAAGHRHRRRPCRDVPAHVLGPPHHPPRHQVLQHPPHPLAARQGGRLRLRPPRRRRRRPRRRRSQQQDARDDAGEGHGGVPGPGVPQDVPAHGPQRRLLLRRAPRGARLGAPPHRDQARDEGAAHGALGHGEARRRRRGGRDGPAPGPRAVRAPRPGDAAGARVPVHGARQERQARHERLLQGAMGHQEDLPRHARRRRRAAALRPNRPVEDLNLTLCSLNSCLMCCLELKQGHGRSLEYYAN